MTRRMLAATLLTLAAALPAQAGNAFSTFGPHVGFSADPSQVVVGGQLQMGDIAPSIDFVPGVDLGLGDNLTLFSINGDFHYRIQVQNMTWQPYAGAGISLHVYNYSNSGFHGNGTVGGGSLIVGADVPTKTGSRFFVEGKFALGDGPSFKAVAGWHFKLR